MHFTFHQILTNCIFLSKPDMSDILLQDDALVLQRKDQSYFISQHWQHEQVYVQSSAPLFSGLCHFDVDAQLSGRGEVACWCETHCWCWCAAHMCSTLLVQHTAHCTPAPCWCETPRLCRAPNTLCQGPVQPLQLGTRRREFALILPSQV